MKRFLSWILKILRLLLLFYTVTLAALYFFQEKLLFHPDVLAADYRFQLKLPYEERRFQSNGLELHSVLVHAKKTKGLLLYLHGNAGDMENWSQVAEELAERTSFDVWMLDYPGFGKSTGKVVSEAQLHEIVKAFYALGVKEAKGPLIIYGRSIGSGLAVKLAAENPVAALVLEAPYFSIRSLAAELFPWFPVSLVLRYPFRSDYWMAKILAPVLIFHGNRDTLIPIESGKALAALLPKAHFVEVEGAGHNDIGDHEEYWGNLLGFLGSKTKN